jgi:polar amino acid transport system substrate-binding protein
VLKKIALLTLTLLVITVAAGYTGYGPALAAPKKVVIGLDDNFPPMGFRDNDGKIVGFDIDMAREAARRLNTEVEFKPIDWSSKEAELLSRRVDLLWNGLTITEARKEKILFSKPYMENRQVIIVKAASPVKDKAGLSGRVIGTQEGSTSVDAVEKEPAVLKSFKEFRTYGDFMAALMDLNNGRLDAVVIDEIVGRYYTAKNPGQYVILAENFGTEEYGVGLRKTDEALLAELQQALDAMKKDGTAARISIKWFGADILK